MPPKRRKRKINTVTRNKPNFNKSTQIFKVNRTVKSTRIRKALSKNKTASKYNEKDSYDNTSETATNVNVKEEKQTNSRLFYPCPYCSELFQQKLSCKQHIEECFKKSSKINNEEDLTPTDELSNQYDKLSTREKRIQVQTDCINNNSCEKNKQRFKASFSIINNNPESEKSVKATVETVNVDDNDEVTIIQKDIPKYDLSVYDFDEETSQELPKNENPRCNKCSFVAENDLELLKHKRTNHSNPIKKIPPHELQKYFDVPDRTICPICKSPIKSRNFRSLFIKHLQVHSSDSFNFECRICKKKFRRSDQWKQHEKRHVLTYAELQEIKQTVYEDDGVCDINNTN